MLLLILLAVVFRRSYSQSWAHSRNSRFRLLSGSCYPPPGKMSCFTVGIISFLGCPENAFTGELTPNSLHLCDICPIMAEIFRKINIPVFGKSGTSTLITELKRDHKRSPGKTVIKQSIFSVALLCQGSKMTIAVSWNRDVPRRSSWKKEAPPQKPATEVAVSPWNRCSGVIGGSKRIPVLFLSA